MLTARRQYTVTTGPWPHFRTMRFTLVHNCLGFDWQTIAIHPWSKYSDPLRVECVELCMQHAVYNTSQRHTLARVQRPADPSNVQLFDGVTEIPHTEGMASQFYLDITVPIEAPGFVVWIRVAPNLTPLSHQDTEPRRYVLRAPAPEFTSRELWLNRHTDTFSLR